jgi:hypothetical protein
MASKNLGDVPTVQTPTQTDVGEQHVELLIMTIDEANRFFAADGLDHGAAIVPKLIDDHRAHEQFVFNDKYDGASIIHPALASRSGAKVDLYAAFARVQSNIFMTNPFDNGSFPYKSTILYRPRRKKR